MGIFYAVVTVEEFFEYFGGIGATWTFRAVAVALMVETAGAAMRIPRRRWTMLFWPFYLSSLLGGWFHATAFVREWPIVFSEIALAILIVMGFRRGDRRDRMIAIAFSVHFLVRLTLSNNFDRWTGMKSDFTVNGWQWQYTTITITGLGTVALVIFVRDLIRDRSEKQRMAAELAAGRAIQQVLIPDSAPDIPGFTIQSAYKPYGEVGGDFFQIIPGADGGVLVAVGDVSGKGMAAAMTVSLLVGSLRTLAHFTQSPSEIMAALNHRMMGRSNGGFTTCLVLRADPDGTINLASAGHIAPYLQGIEVPIENGLPLGLSEESNYPQSSLRLLPHQQLTLLTDGVIEARGKAGALFGFERTQQISEHSAESIAHTAEAFGQDDDITVLTLQRTVFA